MKLYFLNEDANICYPLQYHIDNAKEEGLKEIELFEAIPDTVNTDMVWCSEYVNTMERSECNKDCPQFHCSKASPKSRRCDFRGKLYMWGDIFRFDVETGNQITVK